MTWEMIDRIKRRVVHAFSGERVTTNITDLTNYDLIKLARSYFDESGDFRVLYYPPQSSGKQPHYQEKGKLVIERSIVNQHTIHTIHENISRVHSDDWASKLAAAEILGHSGMSEAVEPLIHLLSDSHYNVRRAAIEGLREIGDKRCIKPLLQRLSQEEDLSILRAIREALNKIGASREEQVSGNAMALRSPNAICRSEAAYTLGIIKDCRSVEALLELFAAEVVAPDNPFDGSRSSRQDVIRAIVNALAALGDKRAIAPLVERYMTLSEKLKATPSTSRRLLYV